MTRQQAPRPSSVLSPGANGKGNRSARKPKPGRGVDTLQLPLDFEGSITAPTASRVGAAWAAIGLLKKA